MKFNKEGKSIEYELVVNDKYPYLDEIKNKVVYLNVRKNHDKEYEHKLFPIRLCIGKESQNQLLVRHISIIF